jgi:hypothetical protein
MTPEQKMKLLSAGALTTCLLLFGPALLLLTPLVVCIGQVTVMTGDKPAITTRKT